MKKDEIRTSATFQKLMKFTNSTDCGKYILYEFTDESNNVALHYQIKEEFLTEKKQIGQARLWNTKVSKLSIGDIAIVICKCREVLESGYNQSAMYLNVDRILKPLTRTKLVIKDYRGVPTEFAVEEKITNWDEI